MRTNPLILKSSTMDEPEEELYEEDRDEADSDSDSDSLFEYASSCSSDDVNEEAEGLDDEPWEQTLGDESVGVRVRQLTEQNCCKNKCLAGKAARVEMFVYSFHEMSKEARRTSLLTALAISAGAVGTRRQRGRNERMRYVYLLPYCGEVCKQAFQSAYEVSNDTLTRTRNQMNQGHCYVLAHKNSGNSNASKIDEGAISHWLRSLAERIGDGCAIRFRTQRTHEGVTTRYVTKQRILFLPPYFTWARLLQEYEYYLAATTPTSELNAIPSLRTFKRIAKERCRDICIRAPQSNVCDVCVIYRVAMTRGGTAIDSENAALHALDSRSMR